MKFKTGNRPKPSNKKANTSKKNLPQLTDVHKTLTRKQLRKQARQQKKARKHAYFTNQHTEIDVECTSTPTESVDVKEEVQKDPEKEKRKKQEQFEKAQLKRRKQFMLEENKREEKHIAILEKRLKLNRRKSKSLPQLFVKDGLDYLLDVCDAQKIPHLKEPELSDADSDFHDDFAHATGQTEHKQEVDEALKKKKSKKVTFSSLPTPESDSDTDTEKSEIHTDSKIEMEEQSDDVSEDEARDTSEEEEEESEKICEREALLIDKKQEKSRQTDMDGCWEDIYGRWRDKDGNVIEGRTNTTGGRYIPPALQRKMEGDDAKKTEILQRLRKQLKGLLNRLSESNINPITSEIEALYMKNARNDMNDSLVKLVMEAIVQPSPTPERMIQEHVLLVTLLHVNVGTEVGAQFLEALVDGFVSFRKRGENYSDGKEMDNLLQLLVHMYTFKVIHSVLIYDILGVLAESFKEKDIELILLILRSAGFSLRKDDPLSLKSVIIKLQGQAGAASNMRDQSRVRFMLDTLMAIRNNNMHKIPNYDPSHTEHLKKLLRSLMRKGTSIVELKISLDDLLNVESRGRWWVVGSAWSGQAAPAPSEKDGSDKLSVDASDKILELARRQRMNTDVRKNIFCIIMTAEDYVDAFEKLLRLSLNNQQEREIIHVTIECCLQEKAFNPYYAFLLQRFCNADRKYQMIIQFTVWDRIKELSTAKAVHVSNLAHLLAHLFLEKALAISVLKVIQFAEMDKASVRFLRQILLEILLHDPEEAVLDVFSKVAKSPKLHTFREGLRLFVRHFVLRNKEKLPSDVHLKLEVRTEAVDKVLSSYEFATKF